MLSPQEIKSIQFSKVMFGGYDMVAVDETMAEIADDFNTVVKENANLKNKLKVLTSTIDEYRSVDEAMRKALITAQNMAQEMVKEAHEKADELIKNASAVASAKVADLAAQISAEEKRLAEIKAESAMFIDAMGKAYKLQSEKLEQLRPDVAVSENATALEDTLSLAANEISKCVESAIENMKTLEQRAKIEDIPEIAPEVDAAVTEATKVIKEEPKKEKYDLSAFDTRTDEFEDTMDFDQVSIDLDGNTSKKAADDDDDFGNLKFGNNYDFDDEE